MNKLLYANFARMKKSKSFWIGMAVMLVYSIGYCMHLYRNKVEYGYVTGADSVFFAPFILAGIPIAIFCSLFIGTEYSDGTIRNKLVVGHSRSSLFLSDFTVCAVGGLLMNLVYLIAACAVGIPLLGFFQTDLSMVLLLLLDGLLLTVAYAAIFSLISILNQNMALAIVISIVTSFVAIFLFVYLASRMNAPEFLPSYSLTVNGTVQAAEKVPNPNYLNDSMRAWFQFFMDFLPAGQAGQIAGVDVPNPGRMPLYSLIIIVLTNAAGVFLFRRKNLK